METIKAKSLRELKRLILLLPKYRQLQKREIEIKELIGDTKAIGKCVDVDLNEELSKIRLALYIDTSGSNVINGYNDNKPYYYNPDGNRSITTVMYFSDKERNIYQHTEYIYEFD